MNEISLHDKMQQANVRCPESGEAPFQTEEKACASLPPEGVILGGLMVWFGIFIYFIENIQE